MSVLDDVLADLETESQAIDDAIAHLDEAGWLTPTPAEGWTIKHQIAHLAWTDRAAVLAATDKAGWDEIVLEAIADVDGFVDAAAEKGAEQPGAEILVAWRKDRARLGDTLRNVPQGEKLPWFGPPMSPTSMATARFMEAWAHGLDVYDALVAAGAIAERPAPTDRIRHVVHLGVRTRNFSFGAHGLEAPTEEFRIDLVAPGGDMWSFGPEDAKQTVTGSAYDFALLVTQRSHRADLDLTAVGDDADRWLDVAQAFAGPPGSKREPA